MYQQELRIPLERVGVVVGKSGEIKKHLEQKIKGKVDIDSKSGEVVLSGEDPIVLMDCRVVVQAIGRGFAPEIAFTLFSEENIMEIVDITQFTGKSKKAMERLKGRVIGADGKARKMIEGITESAVSVYGKTVAVIGEIERVSLARRAVEMLLSGSPHGNVYRWLEDKRRELNRRSFRQDAGILNNIID